MNTPLNPDYRATILRSFDSQGLMHTLGASLGEISAGSVTLTCPITPAISQQDGFAHAGAMWALGDSAAGYSAFSLMGVGERVLTTEMKINLLSPAIGTRIRAVGRVIRFGKTLSTTATEIYADGPKGEKHIATMLGTMMRLFPPE